MSYESRAYDKPNTDGFPPDPVVVLVVEGTHDVSRLIGLLASGQPLIEQQKLAKYILRQVRRHNAGRAALELLAKHGGPDFTEGPDEGLVVELPEPIARSPKGNTWQVMVDGNPVTFEASLHWDDNSPVVETDFAMWDPAELRAHCLAGLAAAENAEQLAAERGAR